MQKKFSELNVGDKFVVNGTEYVKVATVRISCCQSMNAHASENINDKKMFSDETVVVINA